MRNSLV